MAVLRRALVRRQRSDEGAAALEFALVLPILVLLLFGVIQFGLTYFQWQGMQAAAREGARIASLQDTERSEIEGRVQSALSGVPVDVQLGNGLTVSPGDDQPCDGRAGEEVEVTVEAPASLAIPLWDGAGEITLEAVGEFRCE